MAGYIEFKDVKKVYKMGEVEIEALSGVDFSINKGEFVIGCWGKWSGKKYCFKYIRWNGPCQQWKDFS